MRIHFIIHEPFELPGAFEIWAKNKNHQISYSYLYQGGLLPQTDTQLDMLIVMGGPQSPLTTKAECTYFDSSAEQALIIAAKQAGKIVIGVCLGAQLIGQALGSMVEHSPEKEIGVYPIYLTEKGKLNPLINHFGKELMVGHWHGDMPGLSPEAEVLAFSAGCPRQIIVYAPLVYAFQCHMELTPELVKLFITNTDINLNNSQQYAYLQKEAQILSQDYEPMNKQLFIFLDKISEKYLKQLSLNQ